MTAFAFATHKVIKDLEKAGFDEAQAEAVVAALGAVIGGNLVTKADLDVFKAEMLAVLKEETGSIRSDMKEETNSIRSDMKAGYASLHSEMKEETGSIRSDMKEENASIRSDMKAGYASLCSAMQSLELRMTLRLGAIVVIAAAAATAVSRFL